jgi:hypothetical protein
MERVTTAPALPVRGIGPGEVTVAGLTAGGSSKAAIDPELAAAVSAQPGTDELEEMFERGWTDGLPVIPPDRGGMRRGAGCHCPNAVRPSRPPAGAEVPDGPASARRRRYSRPSRSAHSSSVSSE